MMQWRNVAIGEHQYFQEQQDAQEFIIFLIEALDACLLEKIVQIKAELAAVTSQLDSLFMEIQNQNIDNSNSQQNIDKTNQNDSKILHVKIDKYERRKLVLERAVAVLEFKKERTIFTSKEEFMKNNFNIPSENYNVSEEQQESSLSKQKNNNSEIDLQYDSWIESISEKKCSYLKLLTSGQLKSQLCCTVCNSHSNKFESFTSISLDIPTVCSELLASEKVVLNVIYFDMNSINTSKHRIYTIIAQSK